MAEHSGINWRAEALTAAGAGMTTEMIKALGPGSLDYALGLIGEILSFVDVEATDWGKRAAAFLQRLEPVPAEKLGRPEVNRGSEDLPEYDPAVVEMIRHAMPGPMESRWIAMELVCKGIGTRALLRMGSGSLRQMLAMISSIIAEGERIAEDDPGAFVSNTEEEFRLLAQILARRFEREEPDAVK